MLLLIVHGLLCLNHRHHCQHRQQQRRGHGRGSRRRQEVQHVRFSLSAAKATYIPAGPQGSERGAGRNECLRSVLSHQWMRDEIFKWIASQWQGSAFIGFLCCFIFLCLPAVTLVYQKWKRKKKPTGPASRDSGEWDFHPKTGQKDPKKVFYGKKNYVRFSMGLFRIYFFYEKKLFQELFY